MSLRASLDRLGFGGHRITRGARLLLIGELALSLVVLFSGGLASPLHEWVVATPLRVWQHARIWTLATTTFANDSVVGLIFHALILWTFVPALERAWGTRRFLAFAAATSLAANVVGTLVGILLGTEVAVGGLDAFIVGSVFAYGVVFARQPVQLFGALPMTGRQLAIGMTAVILLFLLIGRQWAIGAGYVAALAVAWALAAGGGPRRWWLRWRERRIRSRLSVIRGGADGGKRWMN
jgi:membrane associated rhomboid family serine protease